MDCVFEDGQTSFGLCCFNGCGNTCYQKTCRNVTETVTETIIQQECTDVNREECHDETVTELVTETVMKEQCTGKLISVSGIKRKFCQITHTYFR